MVRRISRTTPLKDLALGGHPRKARERRVSCTRADAFNACSEGNRHQPAPLVASRLESGVCLNRKGAESSFVTNRSVNAMTHAALTKQRERENGHDHIARHRLRGAAARRRRILLQSQGLRRTGGYARTPLPRAVANLGAIGDRTRRELYDRHIVPRPARWVTPFFAGEHRDIPGPRAPLAATHICHGGYLVPLSCAIQPQER